MPLMLRLFRALFPSKERQEFQSRLREPLPSAPPPLPPSKLKYVLYTNGDGSYDIWDGGISQSKQSVDGFFKQPGDEEHDPFWSLIMGDIQYDFETLKDVKAWLGNPPVRRYR